MTSLCPYCDKPLNGELAQTNKGLIHRKCLYLSKGGDPVIVETLFRDEDTKPLFPQHPEAPDPEPDTEEYVPWDCDWDGHYFGHGHDCVYCGFTECPYR